jgi:hypothetical protein
MKSMTDDDVKGSVRRCVVCGTFYPAEAADLRATVDGMLGGVSAIEGKHITGIIAPHAGYAYSGPTAASAYRRLRGASYDAVIIVSPSHREYFEGVSVFDGGGYATPLGVVPVDHELRERLLNASKEIRRSRAGHQSEHAVEVQLPFLQRALGSCSFVPMVIGHQAPETCFALGQAIAEAVDGHNVLLVASTDLSHYYSAEKAHRLDDVIIGDLRAFDEHGLMDHLEAGTTEACGGGPAVAVLSALRILGSSRVEIMNYATSGDVTGDLASVVGYVGAVAF